MSDSVPLRLHVPEPSARPGQTTDFSYLKLSPAGALPGLPLDVTPPETIDYTRGLIRVLDAEHEDTHAARGVLTATWTHDGVEREDVLAVLR